MKRILLDQGLAPKAAALLRAEGWDAVHVQEVGLDRAQDFEILEFARREGRICVTLDHDFHAHLARNQQAGPSVVFIRLEGQAAFAQSELVCAVWRLCEQDLCDGAAVTVDSSSIRVRKLPFS